MMPNRYGNPRRFSLRLVLGVVTALVLGSVGCTPGDGLTDAQHVERAKEFQEQGDLRAAVIELKNAIEQNPENREARWLLGTLYLKAKEGFAAEKELNRAVELGVAKEAVAVPMAEALLLQGEFERLLREVNPEAVNDRAIRAQLYAIRGDAYLITQDGNGAEQAFSRATELDSNHVRARVGRAKLAAMRGEIDAARQAVQSVLDLSPKSELAWSLMGDIERFEGNANEAVDAYTNAIINSFQNLEDRLKRASAYLDLDKLEEAEKDIETLRRLRPRSAIPYHASGLLNFKKEDYPAAQSDFEQALKADPNFMPAVLYLGLTQYRQDYDEQAIRYLNRFLNTYPGNPTATSALAAIRIRQRDYEGARRLLASALERKPNSPELLNMMGSLAFATGRTDEMIEQFQKVVAKAPESGQGRLQLGLSYMLKGDEEKGINELEQALKVDPELGQADTLLVLGHLRAGRTDEALAAASAFIERRPESALAHDLLGLVHVNREQFDQAADAFKEALEREPGDPTACHNLAVLALRNDDKQAAINWYDEGLRYHPNNQAMVLRAAALEIHSGEVGKARERLRAFIGRVPNAEEPRTMLANIYLRHGQPADAVSLLAPVVDGRTANADALATMGAAQLASGATESAIDTLERLAQLERSPRSYSLLAQAYAEVNNAPRLRDTLNRLLALKPDDRAANIAKARMLLLENKLDEATEVTKRLIDAGHEDEMVMDLQASVAMRNRKPEQAAEVYRRMLESHPSPRAALSLARAQAASGNQADARKTLEDWLHDHADDKAVQLSLANFYLNAGDNAAAASLYERLLKAAPDNALVLNNLAWVTLDKDPAKALRYARQARDLRPQAPPVLDTLGVVLLANGEVREAVSVLEEAAQRAPKAAGIQFHLAQAWAQAGRKDKAKEKLHALLSSEQSFAEREQARLLLERL